VYRCLAIGLLPRQNTLYPGSTYHRGCRCFLPDPLSASTASHFFPSSARGPRQRDFPSGSATASLYPTESISLFPLPTFLLPRKFSYRDAHLPPAFSIFPASLSRFAVPLRCPASLSRFVGWATKRRGEGAGGRRLVSTPRKRHELDGLVPVALFTCESERDSDPRSLQWKSELGDRAFGGWPRDRRRGRPAEFKARNNVEKSLGPSTGVREMTVAAGPRRWNKRHRGRKHRPSHRELNEFPPRSVGRPRAPGKGKNAHDRKTKSGFTGAGA
jgi:hypothetical protein